MGSFVNYWFVAFELTLLLSIPCIGALIVIWQETEPESSEGEITPAGKLLLRARLLFTTTCGVIFACLLVLIHFLDVPYDSQPFKWCDEHQQILPLLLVVVAGSSGLSLVLAVTARGEGRRALMIGSVLIAVLSFGVAACLIDFH